MSWSEREEKACSVQQKGAAGKGGVARVRGRGAGAQVAAGGRGKCGRAGGAFMHSAVRLAQGGRWQAVLLSAQDTVGDFPLMCAKGMCGVGSSQVEGAIEERREVVYRKNG